MFSLLNIAFWLVLPPSLLVAYGHVGAVPVYYGVLNVYFGYLFWRHRTARVTVVMCYLLSGMFLFKFLVDPLQVSALPPLPAPPPMLLAGTPHEQAAVGASGGSRWTDWMRAEPARRPLPQRKEAATGRGL